MKENNNAKVLTLFKTFEVILRKVLCAAFIDITTICNAPSIIT